MEGGTMIYVKRTFHPIGQGAFFTRIRIRGTVL